MKTLETNFTGTGEVANIAFNQVQKNDKAFLYELTNIETGRKRFEVFKKTVSKAGEAIIAGVKVIYAEKELYPNSKNFGVWAWCYSQEKDAIEKFNLLTNC